MLLEKIKKSLPVISSDMRSVTQKASVALALSVSAISGNAGANDAIDGFLKLFEKPSGAFYNDYGNQQERVDEIFEKLSNVSQSKSRSDIRKLVYVSHFLLNQD